MSLQNFYNFDNYETIFNYYISNYGPYLDQVVTIIGTRKRIIRNCCDENLQDELGLSYAFPNCFLEEYRLIQISPDGSCFWHSISICLFGNTNFTFILRLLTVFYLLKKKDVFLNLFENELRNSGEQFTNDQINTKAKETKKLTLYEARKMVNGEINIIF
jgi:hypothetical protein